MNTVSLCTDVTTNCTGAGTRLQLDLDGSAGRDEVVAQIQISTGDATVSIEGRIDPDLDWMPLVTAIESGFLSIVRVPYMRAVVSGISGGAVVSVSVFS